jgi:hypothetical protein
MSGLRFLASSGNKELAYSMKSVEFENYFCHDKGNTAFDNVYLFNAIF